MHSIRKFVLLRSVALILAALALSPGLAAAQSGTFHLPLEVKWGKSTLPVGDYSYSVDTGTPGNVVFIRSLSEHWGVMMVASSLSGEQPQKDQLVLTRDGDGAFVTAFCLKDYGVLTYYVVKAKNSNSTASARMQRQPTLASASAQ